MPKISTKNLYLIRHAKAKEKESYEKDIERMLNSQGLQNATRMGINLAKKSVSFDTILCSPSERTQQTAMLIAEQIKFNTDKIHINPNFYEASTRSLLQNINQFKEEWKNVLLVGHNPSISYLSEFLTNKEIGNVTTCGLLHIKFNNSKWADIIQNSGTLISYEYPELLDF